MSDVKSRITQFVEHQKISRRQFLLSCGFSESYFHNMSRGLSYEAMDKIKDTYPDLSMPWLVLGEGSMLKSESKTASQLQDTGTPLLPVEAWGGSLSGSSITVLAEQCKKYNVPISNIDYLIPIAGDSMMPDYCPGDVVGIKKINESAFIEWGKVYVLDTCNGVVIKEVQPSENEGCITCISRNEPAKYKPFDISLNPEHFYGMYAVKGTVRIS